MRRIHIALAGSTLMLLFVLISGIQPAQAQSCPGTLRGADCTNYNRAVETFYGLENAVFEFEYRVTTEMGNMSSSTTSIRGSGRFFVDAQGNIDNMFLLLDSASMDMGGFFSGGISSYDGLAEGATNYIIAIVDGRLLLCRGVSGEGSCDSYDASQLRMPLSRLDPNVGLAHVAGISTSWAVSEQTTSDIPAYASFAQSNAPMAEALGMLGGQMGSPGSGDSMMGSLLGSMFGSGFDSQMQTQAAYGGLISLNAAENRIQALNQITSASTDISGMVGQDLFSSLVGTTSVVTQANNIGFFSINDPELERETLDNIPYTIRPASGGSIYIAAANNTSIFGLAQAYYLPLLMGGQLNNGVSSTSGSSSSSSGSTTVTALSPISALNGSVSATLPSGRTFDYTYQAEAGETVTFLLTAEDFDTFLELFNADGSIITADDDSGGNLDSLITRTFSASGEYVLRVRSFGNSSGGPFTLTATRAGSAGGTTSSGSSSSGGTTSGSASGSTNPMTLESGARDMGVFEVEAGGTMRSGEQHDYTYLAQGGETVTFYLTSEDFDTYIEVYNEFGDFIASDDDSGGSLDSLITITLNDPGAYLVRTRSFGNSGSGDYALIATVEDFGSSTSESTSSGTTSGTTSGAQASGELVSVVSGNLPAGTQQDFTYSAQAGERATFLLASAAFDTFLELYGPSGGLLSSDDDSGGNLDSRITHTFGGAGEYVLRVRSFNNNSGGAFTLTVEGTTAGTAPSSSSSSTTASAAGTLAGQLTDVINGTLPDGDTLDYGYTAEAGETATFLLAAPQFDTFLELLDASGDIIESDDDSGGSLDSMLTYTFRQAGDYVLRVRSFGNSDGGAFTLSLESTTAGANQAAPTAAPPATSSSVSSGLLPVSAGALDGTRNGTLSAGRVFEYLYSAQANEQIQITLTTSAFSPLLELNYPDGGPFIAGTVSGNTASISITLPEAGTWRIRVSDANGAGAGAFTVSLVSLTAQQAAIDAQIEAAQTEDLYVDNGLLVDSALVNVEVGLGAALTYQATAGETVTFTVESETMQPLLELLDNSGEIIAYDLDESGLLRASLTFTFEESDTYTLHVREMFFSDEGVLRVTAESSGASAFTQPDAIPLTGTYSGTLTEGETLFFAYDATSGQSVEFRAEGEGFTPEIVLRDNDGNFLAEGGDPGFNVGIIPYTLPLSETYYLEIRPWRNGNGPGGNFSLSVTVDGEQPSASSAAAGTTAGTAPSSSSSSTTSAAAGGLAGQLTDVINGTLPDGDTLDYGYTAEAGETATFLLAAPQFDTFLELLDASGDIIESDDDSGGSLDSMLTYTFRQAGDYVLRVRSFGNSDGGAFTLSLESTTAGTNQAAPTAAPTTAPPATSSSVSSGLLPVRGGGLDGGARRGVLNAGNIIEYVYTAEADEMVLIELTSTDFAPQLEVFRPDNTVANRSTVSDGTLSISLNLTQAGTWRVRVSDATGTGSGAFVVSLTQQSEDEVGAVLDTREVVSGDTITYGEQVTGTLEGAPILLTFTGTSGDEVFMALTSSDFDTYLILRDDRGTLIAENDDYDGTNSQIVYTLSKSGTYQIEVRGYYESAEGTFFLNFGG